MSAQEFLITAWSWKPLVLAGCVLTLVLYTTALRGHLGKRACSFFVGVAMVYVTLASPLNVLAHHYLFSAHMVQHLLFLLVAPPLLLLGLPPADMQNSESDRPWARFRVPPLLGWTAGVGGMWIWHEPLLFEAAMHSVKKLHTGQPMVLMIGPANLRP